MTPRQTVAYWIEHVIKYGHEHLRSHAMDLAWYEYFMIDVFAFLAAIVVVLVVGLWLTVKILWSFAKLLLCGRARM
jgi:glucuronosyltransferase